VVEAVQAVLTGAEVPIPTQAVRLEQTAQEVGGRLAHNIVFVVWVVITVVVRVAVV
jgi:hypothetical protein